MKVNIGNIGRLAKDVTQFMGDINLDNRVNLAVKNKSLLELSKDDFVKYDCGVLFNIAGICQIKASGCGIVKLPDEIGNMLMLEKVYLSGNGLSGLPDSMSRLVNLAYLDLSGNTFSEVPFCVRQLPKLTHLNLKGNPIAKELPADLITHCDPQAIFGHLRTSIRNQVTADGQESRPGFNMEQELQGLSAITSVAEDNMRYLKELALVVQANKLVPFVGAGMSYPVGLKLWGEALEAIYQQAKPSLTVDHAVAYGGATATTQLPEAAQVLWEAMGDKWFNDRIKALFGKDTLSTAKIKAAPIALLPDIATGPVLTTNFDPILERIYGDFTNVVLGEYRADALLGHWDDKKHFLLKLHGDADETTGRVLTKAQYDRAYDEAGGSRLPELLRTIFSSRRPLLFLGCSLEMDRTIIELQKAGLQLRNAYHFALLPDPGAAERLARQNVLVGKLGIQPIWLSRFDDIRPVLEFLSRARRAPNPISS